jgi:hypothetical protein
VPKSRRARRGATPSSSRFIFLPFAQAITGRKPTDIFNEPQAFIPLLQAKPSPPDRSRGSWSAIRRTEWYYYRRTGVPDAAIHLRFDTGSHLDGRVA